LSERRTLERLLSRLGLCSRSTALRLIQQGRVSVDGRVERSLERWVDPVRERVTLDGRALRAAERLTLCLNKPRGVLTSFGDPEGRRTVYDLLADLPVWVFPVGRLDRDTSGLLLLTNDSDFAEGITNPVHGIPKRYRAVVSPAVGEPELEALRRGLLLTDGPTLPARAALVGRRGPNSVVELEIVEGRNRQVRRMFRALGRSVRELRREGVGPVLLGELPSGRTRPLSAEERRALELAARRAQPRPG